MIVPFTPTKAKEEAEKHHEKIIHAFNTLLTEQGVSEIIVIKVKAVREVISFGDTMTFDLLNGAAKLFTKYGWDVEYDAPGYNEHYEARWLFTRRK